MSALQIAYRVLLVAAAAVLVWAAVDTVRQRRNRIEREKALATLPDLPDQTRRHHVLEAYVLPEDTEQTAAWREFFQRARGVWAGLSLDEANNMLAMINDLKAAGRAPAAKVIPFQKKTNGAIQR